MRPVIPYLCLAALVAIWGAVFYLDRDDDQRAATAQTEVLAKVAALERTNADLHAALEQERARDPGVRIVTLTQAATGRVTAAGPALPPVTCPPVTAADPAPTCPACLVVPGSPMDVRLDQVEAQRTSGQRRLVGSLSAWRLEPAPATPIASGTFDIEAPPETVPKAGWGIGGLVLATSAGAYAGLVGAAPPVRVLSLTVEGSLGLAVGASGVAAAATVIVRRAQP